MSESSRVKDWLWIIGELGYYLGLTLFLLAIPALTLSLFIMELVDKVSPNYLYLFIAWMLSLLMFLLAIKIKNYLRE